MRWATVPPRPAAHAAQPPGGAAIAGAPAKRFGWPTRASHVRTNIGSWCSTLLITTIPLVRFVSPDGSISTAKTIIFLPPWQYATEMLLSSAKYSPRPCAWPCWPRRLGSRPCLQIASMFASAVPWKTRRIDWSRARLYAAANLAYSSPPGAAEVGPHVGHLEPRRVLVDELTDLLALLVQDVRLRLRVALGEVAVQPRLQPRRELSIALARASARAASRRSSASTCAWSRAASSASASAPAALRFPPPPPPRAAAARRHALLSDDLDLIEDHLHLPRKARVLRVAVVVAAQVDHQAAAVEVVVVELVEVDRRRRRRPPPTTTRRRRPPPRAARAAVARPPTAQRRRPAPPPRPRARRRCCRGRSASAPTRRRPAARASCPTAARAAAAAAGIGLSRSMTPPSSSASSAAAVASTSCESAVRSTASGRWGRAAAPAARVGEVEVVVHARAASRLRRVPASVDDLFATAPPSKALRPREEARHGRLRRLLAGLRRLLEQRRVEGGGARRRRARATTTCPPTPGRLGLFLRLVGEREALGERHRPRRVGRRRHAEVEHGEQVRLALENATGPRQTESAVVRGPVRRGHALRSCSSTTICHES